MRGMLCLAEKVCMCVSHLCDGTCVSLSHTLTFTLKYSRRTLFKHNNHYTHYTVALTWFKFPDGGGCVTGMVDVGHCFFFFCSTVSLKLHRCLCFLLSNRGTQCDCSPSANPPNHGGISGFWTARCSWASSFRCDRISASSWKLSFSRPAQVQIQVKTFVSIWTLRPWQTARIPNCQLSRFLVPVCTSPACVPSLSVWEVC